MKQACENCPAKNSRVRWVEIKKGEVVTKRLLLCGPCHQALNRIIREQNEREQSGRLQTAS